MGIQFGGVFSLINLHILDPLNFDYFTTNLKQQVNKYTLNK